MLNAIRISNSSYQYLKANAKQNKRSIINEVDFIIQTFKIYAKDILEPFKQNNSYSTCKLAFFEQTKHTLPDHERNFYENDRKRLNQYIQENNERYQIFKIVYLQQKKKSRKENLKQYNHEYYLRHKND